MNLLGTKTLETERLILRKYRIEDALDMYNNWGTDPNCNIYLPWDNHKNIEETKEIITEWINSYKEDKFQWIIELKEEGIAIGGINVVKISKSNNICEVGYCIGSKFWGKGYTTEALKKVLEYLFLECNFSLIEAEHHKSNIASGKVMLKSGMIKDGELRNRAINRKTNELENIVVYSITKDEYIKQKTLKKN